MSKVPAGWSEDIFGNVMSFKNGLNFTKSDSGETIKIVGVGDFKDYSELRNTQHLEFIQVANKIREEELLKDGDLLFVRSNGNKNLIGRCLFFPFVNERLSYSGFTIRGRVDSNKVLPEYASYLSRSSSVKEQINQNGGGTNISNLSQQILNDIEFLRPTLPEQTKIAQILSIWDKAIATTEKLIGNSQQQKKALMQSLLTGKKRLPGFEGEWKTHQLAKMGKIVSGGTPDTNNPQFWDGDILWMTPTDVTALKTKYIKNTSRKITKIGVQESSAKAIPAGSLLVCTRATIGLMSISSTEITTNQGFKNLVPNEKFNVEFLYFLFSFYKKYFIRYACGSTFLELSKKDFEKLEFSCPLYTEQQKIAAVLTAADNEIELLQKKLAFLKQEKAALMQQLLTGKRRVKIDTTEECMDA
ncbi:restriction endonuclease subunit S [Rahnella aquatilis]|jgi:type I restriction enzyme S subunit|nr:restriction endonuclease subunit S [Rahnella aquatilis]AZP44787.1 restriction endonuclease subunit S [Rahnella aquatilis]